MNLGASLRLVVFFASAACGLRAAAPASPETTKPPPLDVSAVVLIGYDDNLYGIDTGRLSRVGSGFTNLSARIAARPAAGISLAYSPSVATFFDEPREDHVKHLLSASGRGVWGDALSWSASTEALFVDGDDRGVNYGPGCGHAFSTALPRERRDQWQNRSDVALRHDAAFGFVRGVGRLQYWDMHTAPDAGANYVDRHDVSGGLDLGRSLREAGPEIYLGYRRGYQFQDRDASPSSPRHASNHYDRTLAGFDGKLASALRLSAQTGWARHAYPGDPIVYAGSAHEEGLYTDATLVWTPTRDDEVQFKTSRCRTMSTTGVNSILLTTHQLSWRRALGERWSATVGARFIDAEYAPAKRDDVLYTATASLACKIDDSWSATLNASRDWGRDAHNDVTGAGALLRDFDRHVVSVALTWKR